MNVIKKTVTFFVALSIILSLMSSCTPSPLKQKYTSYSFDYFDTVTTVIGYEHSEDVFNGNFAIVERTLEKYHKLFDIYNSYPDINNLYTVNSLQDGVHTEVEVDRSIIELLLAAKDMYEKSGGEFNVAMGGVLKIWHKYRTAGELNPNSARLPSMEKLEAAAQHTDFSSIVINEERSTVFITDPEVTIDVGAIGKGYATEMAAEALNDAGVTGYLLNVGGNVRAIGSKPNGNWTLGIQNPDLEAEEAYIEKISAQDISLVTSGSYQRFYEVDGVAYHHIIDRDTLMPATHFTAVSVIYGNSGIADALSTALFCMSYDEGTELLSHFDGAEAIWICTDGEIFYSSGFSAYITE